MIVKLKCKCGKKHKISVNTLKDARKTKLKFKNNYVCNVCQYRIIARGFVKEVAKGLWNEGGRKCII